MIVAVMFFGLVTGCSGGMNPRGWLGGDPKDQANGETVYYAGVDDLTVREAPEASAEIVGRLALHEKVFRSEVAKGYARVRTADSRLTGWVVNARLIWKLPADRAGEQAPGAATENAVAAESPPASEPAPAAALPDEPAPEAAVPDEPPPPADDGSSVFDPY
jgi:hypothetical protein